MITDILWKTNPEALKKPVKEYCGFKECSHFDIAEYNGFYESCSQHEEFCSSCGGQRCNVKDSKNNEKFYCSLKGVCNGNIVKEARWCNNSQ